MVDGRPNFITTTGGAEISMATPCLYMPSATSGELAYMGWEAVLCSSAVVDMMDGHMAFVINDSTFGAL